MSAFDKRPIANGVSREVVNHNMARCGLLRLRNLLFCILILAGCSAPNATTAPKPELSEFQQALAKVAVEAQRSVHLVEMGAPEVERDAQQTVLRRVVAGLSPSTDEERHLTEVARNLVTVMDGYSATATSLYLTVRSAKKADREVHDYSSEFRAQMTADLAQKTQERYNESRDRAKELLAQLNKHDGI